jgi:hypothetical protein
MAVLSAPQRIAASSQIANRSGSMFLCTKLAVDVQREIAAQARRRLDRAGWDADRALRLRQIIADGTLDQFADLLYETDQAKSKAALKALGDEKQALQAFEVVTRISRTGETTVTTVRTRARLQDKQHAIDMLEEARRRAGPVEPPAIDMEDYTDEELATVRRISEAVLARREAKQWRQIEPDRSQYRG